MDTQMHDTLPSESVPAGEDDTLPSDGSMRTSRADARSGTWVPVGGRIGRFVVTGELGAGGMGVVYAADDPELSRRLAIKVIREDGDATQSDGLHQRLLREAQAMAQVAHPNLVTVYDVGEHDGSVFIAMEYVPGKTLKHWRSEDRPDPSQIVEAYVQAAAGLQAAHEAGLVHRDFKPSNALIDPRDRVRVLDFGLARATMNAGETQPEGRAPGAEALAVDLTRTGALMGTPAYMAPEQFHGAPTDARTDQFAFCVALYEALYGDRPFEGETTVALMANVTEGVLRPRPALSQKSPAIYDALLRGLEVDPDARHPNMDALAAALRPAQAPGGGRRWVLGATVALALAAGITAFVLTRGNDADPVDADVAAEVGPAPEHGLATLDGFRHDLDFDGTATRWKAAAEDLDEACRRAPSEVRWCAGAAFTAGRVLQLEGDDAGGLAKYDEAEALEPNWELPPVGRASALNQLGRSDEALKAARRAQRLAPEWVGAIMAGVDALRGADDLDEAISETRRALDLQPEHPTLLADLAILYHARELDSEAERYAKQALEVDPDSMAALVLLAERGLEARDHAQALEYATRATGVGPKSVTAWLARADALLGLGRERQAKDAFAKVMELVALEPEHGAPPARVEAVRKALDAGELPPPRYPADMEVAVQRSQDASPAKPSPPRVRSKKAKKKKKSMGGSKKGADFDPFE